jgi:hypothetical protein
MGGMLDCGEGVGVGQEKNMDAKQSQLTQCQHEPDTATEARASGSDIGCLFAIEMFPKRFPAVRIRVCKHCHCLYVEEEGCVYLEEEVSSA